MVAALQQAAKAGGNPPLLIATDQEGGPVRRFPQGPPFDSAATMGRNDTAADVTAIGRATGTYLRSAGVDVDLAPVLDVTSSPSSFLGTRAFGMSVAVVTRAGPAFAQGVQQARVAATGKHFPGLGTAGETRTSAPSRSRRRSRSSSGGSPPTVPRSGRGSAS